ncbi:MAG: hypothetical protein ACPLTR_02230 [Thermacetogeniaceae bacterium]
MHWKSLCLGFVWGTAVSIGNYCYLKLVVKRSEKRSPRDKILSVVRCYIVRYFINMGALFCGYWLGRDIWAIAGIGFGLTVMKNITAVLELGRSWKGSQRGNTKKEKNYYVRLLDYPDDDFFE